MGRQGSARGGENSGFTDLSADLDSNARGLREPGDREAAVDAGIF